MGMVFGRVDVAEPAFKILHTREGAHDAFSYEVRQYGERFAAETSYNVVATGNGDGDGDNGSAFTLLARYIGVFGGAPENEGKQAISMTAPVIMEDRKEGGVGGGVVGEKISMTAPVVIENDPRNDDGTGGGSRVMQFMLPAEFDSLSKIPAPTNPAVRIREIPPAVGAVHRYSGRNTDAVAADMAARLAGQLRRDGVPDVSDEYAVGNHQFWGYNPPFTIPMLRRNEVWVPLSPDQVESLVPGYEKSSLN